MARVYHSPPRRLNETAVFFGHERASRLLEAAPPYGLRTPGFDAPRLAGFLENATVPRERRFGTCAVVGNAGSLSTARWGAEIDAHDAVFRLQHQDAHMTAARRPATGSRTTWWVVASRWTSLATRLDRHSSEHVLVVCDRPFVYSCQNLLHERRWARVHMLNPLFYAAVQQLTGGRIPLTGVVAVAVATRLCASVSAYGFSTDDPRACQYFWDCSQSDHAYNRRRGDAHFHDFFGNRALLDRWNRSGAVAWRDRPRRATLVAARSRDEQRPPAFTRPSPWSSAGRRTTTWPRASGAAGR